MLFNCDAREYSWVLWTTRRSNQSIQKVINPAYSLEGPMLKLQYSGHLMQRADSLEKILMLGNIEGRRRGKQSLRWLDDISDSMGREFEQTPGDGEGQGSLACCSQTLLNNWTTMKQIHRHREKTSQGREGLGEGRNGSYMCVTESLWYTVEINTNYKSTILQ